MRFVKRCLGFGFELFIVKVVKLVDHTSNLFKIIVWKIDH